MAEHNSKYYYDLYRDKKSKAKQYKNDKEDLQSIKNAMSDNMYDEIGAVNGQLDELTSDLKESVRHNAAFTRHANDLGEKKEKTVTADGQLSVAVRELEEEIQSLTSKYNQAVSDRDYYKRKCQEKLEEEGKPSWYYWF